jgi:hypothetical protein
MQIDVGTSVARKASSRGRASRPRIWDLGFNSCRWPVGSTSEPAVFFCGEPAVGGCSWCAEHRQLAFVRNGARARA